MTNILEPTMAAAFASSTDMDIHEMPMSRTHQYRKVMKPLLERKRRARINKCLDELKDLMVYALQAEGESITKLEKADVLELTVRHLQKLKRQNKLQAVDQTSQGSRIFSSGFTACATEVGRCLASAPATEVDVKFGTGLMTHLGLRLKELDSSVDTDCSHGLSPLSVSVQHQEVDILEARNCRLQQQPMALENGTSFPSSMKEELQHRNIQTPTTSDCGYSSGRDSVSPRIEGVSTAPSKAIVKEESKSLPVWRPF